LPAAEEGKPPERLSRLRLADLGHDWDFEFLEQREFVGEMLAGLREEVRALRRPPDRPTGGDGGPRNG